MTYETTTLRGRNHKKSVRKLADKIAKPLYRINDGHPSRKQRLYLHKRRGSRRES